MQQFYRPNGDSTQKRGVLADVELPSLTTHLDVGEADLDYPVAFDQRRAAQLPARSTTSIRPICDQLRQLSQQRVQASTKFQNVAPQHRPLQGAEGQEVRHAQRGEVPQGAGGTQRRQGRGKGHRKTQRV